ncbi:Fmp27p [Lachancea thermotolerans CBS 6340]|uniref:KLTH0F18546p n=1 Tax=Lachancea thermotolerans (strain ATCC 56472 / CBS 6340 / NRRL Y-8284) TaxID=559295 RepID=C5DJR6_LACTC|nr:KLTH0F18546p [Lachancea thermotolerans CBS 6340]CAR24555.1 KLTH0F18546p [Lachancea thermotolerans CBS 6340]
MSWEQTTDFALKHKYIILVFVEAAVGWAVFQWILFKLLGISVGIIDPLRLRVRSLRFREILRIRFVYYSLWNHGIVVHGLQLNLPYKRQVKESAKSNKPSPKNYFSVPRWAQWLIIRFLNLFKEYNFVLEKIEINGVYVELLTAKLVGNREHMRVSIYMKDVTKTDIMKCDGTLLEFSGRINFQHPILPLEDMSIDIKLRDVSISYDQLTKSIESAYQQKAAERSEAPANESHKDHFQTNMQPVTTGESIEYIKSLLLKASDFVTMFDRFYVALDTVCLADIPFTRHPELRKTADHLKFKVDASNVTLSINRLKVGSPGFKLLFSPGDSPLSLKSTISSIAFSSSRVEDDKALSSKPYNFCEIPSVSLYGDTNLLSLRSLEEDGNPLNTVLKLVGHVSSPVVDFEISQLSFMKAFKDNLKVFQSLLSDDITVPVVESRYEQTLKRKQAVASYFQHILPMIESKVTIEDPMILISDDCELLVQKCSILSIQTRSTKYALGGEQKKEEVFYKLRNSVEMTDYNFTYQDKVRKFEHQILAIDSVSMLSFSQLIPIPLVGCTINVDVFNLDLSELSTLMALNKIFRKTNSKMLLVEDEYFDDLYCKFSEMLEAAAQKGSKLDFQCNETDDCPTSLLFKPLPSFFDGIRGCVCGVSITVGARSVFMSKDVLTDLRPQSPEDLVNGELRKMSHSVEKVSFYLSSSNSAAPSMNDVGGSDDSTLAESAKMFSYDELGLEDSNSSFSSSKDCVWLFRCVFQDMVTTLYSEKRTKRQALCAKTICKLPEFEASVYPSGPLDEKGEVGSNKILTRFGFSECEMMFSLMTLFLVFSAIHTFRQTFASDVNKHGRDSKAKKHLALDLRKPSQKSPLSRLIKTDTLDVFQVDFNAKALNMVIILPNGVKTRLEMFQTSLGWANISEISLQGHFLRFCVESPQITNTWVRMATVVNFKIEGDIYHIFEQIQKPPEGTPKPSVVLSNEMWHFNIPHGFAMCRIIDNITTTAKSIKQMVHSLKTSERDSVIHPHVSNPVLFPVITLKSYRWIFSVEDDAFESQLGMIFQVGLEEQRSRIEKYNLFERSIAKELSTRQKGLERRETTLVNLKEKSDQDHAPEDKAPSRNNSESMLPRQGVEWATQESDRYKEYHQFLENAETRAKEFYALQKQISLSWIRRIQSFKMKERIDFSKNFEYLWGKINPNCFPPGANKKIVAFLSSPPLMNMIIERINVTISQPSFGIEKVPDFINDVGKGVPRETKYSIMVPMHLNAEFGEIRSHLKDYPLPFVHIPDFTDSQSDADFVPIHIHGDIIISEDKLWSEKELRTLFVPLVPSATLENDDELYSILVPRTLTAIKTYTSLEFELNSEETTMVTWNGSYSPAIQQVMQCFENFSKPPIDPSPKLGFWDKIRETFHARVAVKWNRGGQLNVALKGGKSPYMMGGESAGFIVGLKGKVAVGCNKSDDSKKFVSLASDEIFFSIPNYFAKPLFSWSSSSKNFFFFPSYDNTNLQQHAFFYHLIDLPDANSLSQDMKVMRDSFFEKTAIRLTGGITLNVGIVFERMKNGRDCRTLESKPHWETRLCNPVFVKELSKHDSFGGFRSDFIHLSFTLLSSNENAYNVLQLTPGGFKTFFGWWKSFSGILPVRRGPLFGMDSMSPKFGLHLYTISYHADVAPLFISHIHNVFDLNSDARKKDGQSTDFVGLKAKTEHFVMDLHQRREVMHEYKPVLETTKKNSKLAFNGGDVSTFEIDVRTVRAQFKESSSVDRESSLFEISDDDMTWFDVADFKEVHCDSLEDRIPSVSIDSLVYSPKFVYRKHASYGDKYQVDFETCEKIEPFQNSNYHDCSLHDNVRSPVYLIDNRLKALEAKRKEVENQINEISTESGKNKRDLSLKLGKIKEAISQVSKLLTDFEEFEDYDVTEQGDVSASNTSNEKDNDYAECEWLTKKSFSKTFEHRFFIFCMFLKWNETVRDTVYSYVHLIDLNREFAYITNHKAVQKLEDFLRDNADENIKKLSTNETSKHEKTPSLMNESVRSLDANEDILSVFEEGLRTLNAGFDYITHDNHVVQFIAPQIQLTTTRKSEVCTMITAPSIKLKTIGFDTNTTENENNSDVFMNRYSVALLKANVFVFHKDNFENYHDVFFSSEGYDQLKGDNWQPWLGVELCFDSKALVNDALIRDLSGIFRFDRVFSFANISSSGDTKLENRMICQLPRTIISSNSRQYLALYDVVTHLLIYVEPKSAHLRKEVEKLMLSYDSTNIAHLKKVAMDLQQKVVALNLIEKELTFRRPILEADGIDDLKTIRKNKNESLIGLYILMKVLNTGSQEQAANDQRMLWDLEAKEIILHMLHEDGGPFLDVALAKSFFQRIQSSYGYNSNRVVIGIAQIFNLDRDVLFHSLMSPSEGRKGELDHGLSKKPMIELEWEIERPVGGMKVIKNAISAFQGLDINVEQETLSKIVKWVFPSEIEQYIDGPQKQASAKESDDDVTSSMSGQQSLTIGEINDDPQSSQPDPQDVNEMFKRSSDYMVIDRMVVNSFVLTISYRGHGAKRLINVTHFGFLFPHLTIINQTMRMVDLVMVLKQVILKSLLKHAGKFLGNKLKKHNVRVDSPGPQLQQLSSYRTFTNVDDLKVKGPQKKTVSEHQSSTQSPSENQSNDQGYAVPEKNAHEGYVHQEKAIEKPPAKGQDASEEPQSFSNIEEEASKHDQKSLKIGQVSGLSVHENKKHHARTQEIEQNQQEQTAIKDRASSGKELDWLQNHNTSQNKKRSSTVQGEKHNREKEQVPIEKSHSLD